MDDLFDDVGTLNSVKLRLHENGSLRDGKDVSVPRNCSFEKLLRIVGEKFGIRARRLFTSEGAEIDDITLLEDGDLVFISPGNDFIAPSNASTGGGRRRRRNKDVENHHHHHDGEGGGGGDNLDSQQQQQQLHGTGIISSGEVVGGYRVGRILGKGGFGEVRSGTHVVTGETSAMKFLPVGGDAMSAAGAERVTTEIACLSELQHTHVIRLLQVVNASSYVAIILENAPYGDLKQYVDVQIQRHQQQFQRHQQQQQHLAQALSIDTTAMNLNAVTTATPVFPTLMASLSTNALALRIHHHQPQPIILSSVSVPASTTPTSNIGGGGGGVKSDILTAEATSSSKFPQVLPSPYLQYSSSPRSATTNSDANVHGTVGVSSPVVQQQQNHHHNQQQQTQPTTTATRLIMPLSRIPRQSSTASVSSTSSQKSISNSTHSSSSSNSATNLGIGHAGIPEEAWVALEEQDARNKFAQIARGVAYAHSRHIVHRDLKLENILIGVGGEMKISDFGLSQYSADDGIRRDGGGADPSGASGSLYYMAPETFAPRPPPPGPALDVWSSAVLLYTMFTGRLPFVSPAVLKAEAALRAEAAAAAAANTFNPTTTSPTNNADVTSDETTAPTGAHLASPTSTMRRPPRTPGIGTKRGAIASHDTPASAIDGTQTTSTIIPSLASESVNAGGAGGSMGGGGGAGGRSRNRSSSPSPNTHNEASSLSSSAVVEQRGNARGASADADDVDTHSGLGSMTVGMGEGSVPAAAAAATVPHPVVSRDFFKEAEDSVESTIILKEVKASIMSPKPYFPRHMPAQMKSLLKFMWTTDPSLRPTMADVLSHPWLSSNSTRTSMEAEEAATADAAEAAEHRNDGIHSSIDDATGNSFAVLRMLGGASSVESGFGSGGSTMSSSSEDALSPGFSLLNAYSASSADSQESSLSMSLTNAHRPHPPPQKQQQQQHVLTSPRSKISGSAAVAGAIVGTGGSARSVISTTTMPSATSTAPSLTSPRATIGSLVSRGLSATNILPLGASNPSTSYNSVVGGAGNGSISSNTNNNNSSTSVSTRRLLSPQGSTIYGATTADVTGTTQPLLSSASSTSTNTSSAGSPGGQHFAGSGASALLQRSRSFLNGRRSGIGNLGSPTSSAAPNAAGSIVYGGYTAVAAATKIVVSGTISTAESVANIPLPSFVTGIPPPSSSSSSEGGGLPRAISSDSSTFGSGEQGAVGNEGICSSGGSTITYMHNANSNSEVGSAIHNNDIPQSFSQSELHAIAASMMMKPTFAASISATPSPAHSKRPSFVHSFDTSLSMISSSSITSAFTIGAVVPAARLLGNELASVTGLDEKEEQEEGHGDPQAVVPDTNPAHDNIGPITATFTSSVSTVFRARTPLTHLPPLEIGAVVQPRATNLIPSSGGVENVVRMEELVSNSSSSSVLPPLQVPPSRRVSGVSPVKQQQLQH